MRTDPLPLSDAKARLRRDAERRRAAVADGAAAAKVAGEHLLATLTLPPAAPVSGYWPMRSEFDPRPVLRELQARGHRLCLPVVVGTGQPLLFRAWRFGEPLVAGGFGTQVPDDRQAEVVPRVLLVPMLAFDRAGYRLGYGGGFYDRTLAALRAAGEVLAVGLAFAAQEVDTVPHDNTDARLDWIVTEAGALRME
jgi:5-formyltetrahydrofolate cyclo-ligase